jgi:integrase
MRVGEILGLHWKDLDFSLRLIHVRTRTIAAFSEHRRRTLPFPQPLIALQALQSTVKLQEPDVLVFQTSRGTPYNDTNLLKRDLKPAGKKLGIPWLN